MLEILLTAAIAFVISFLAIPVVIQIADKKELYDVPDARKLHKQAISSLGGIGIFGGFFLASLLVIDGSTNPEFQYFFAAASMIFFLGLKDDLVALSASKKFFGQVLIAAVIIHLAEIRIDSMYGLFNYEQLPETFSLVISYFTIILIINAFNLIDGVDGLSTGLGLLATTVFGIYFSIIGQMPYALLSFALMGSLAAFLIFNHHPAKIFMGDSGSMLIGLVCSILVIKFINVANDTTITVPIASAPVVGISILFLPLLDTFRVFSIRILNGRSPFSPDRNHIHHLLLDRGLSHSAVSLTCLVINIAFIVLAYSFRNIGPSLLLALLVGVAFSGLGIVYYSRKKERAIIIAKRKDGATEMKTSSRVVTLTQEKSVADKS